MARKITPATLIPIGILFTAIGATAAAVRAFDVPEKNIAVIDSRLSGVESQQTKVDEHLERITADLALIKERLGIVENRRK